MPHTVQLPGGLRGVNTVVRGGDGHVYPRGPFTGPYDPVYPSAPPSPTDVNSAVNTNPGALAAGSRIPLVYGLQQVEGRVIWRGHNVTKWTIIVGICAGPIAAVTSCKINDATASGVTITYFLGTASQATCGLDTFYAGGTYRLPYLAYAQIDYSLADTAAYAAANKFAFIIQGKLCTDPRENRFTYSNDFRTTRGWSSATTFPTLSADGKSGTGGASDGWNGTSASTYTFSATPGTYEFYRQETLGLASGDPLTATIRMRATTSFTATMEVSKGASATTQSITVDTSWRTYRLTNTGSGTGNGKLRIYGIPASTVLSVTRASLQIKSEDYGYIETQGSVVTPNTVAYSTNPVLQIFDYALDTIYGAKMASADVNAANFGRAAGDADHATETGSSGYYQAGIVINSDTTVRAVFEALRAYCGAQLYEEAGQLCIWVDVAQEDVLVAFDTTNAKDVTLETIDVIDKPTRVTVEYTDSANSYKTTTAQADDQGLTSPATVDLRETKYVLPGITDTVHALRIANYYLKLAQADLRASWTCPWVGVRLYKGALVTLTCGTGLSAQRFLVETVKRLPTGEYGIEARKYDSAVYNSSAVTANTPNSINLVDPYTAPSAPIIGYAGSLQYLAIGKPRISYSSTLAASTWSTTNCTGVTASAINDGSTGATAFTTAPTSTTVPANYAYVQLDVGAGTSGSRFGKVALTITAASSGAASSAVAGVWWQWSDDASTWVNATSPTYTPKAVSGASTTWTITWEFPCKSPHRYWRMVQADTVGFAGLEIQFYTFNENLAVHHYDLTVGGTSVSTRTGVLAPIIADLEPTIENPLTLVAPGYSSYTLDALGYGSQGTEGHISVRAVTTAGVNGSWASSDQQYISSATGTDTVARIQTSSPGTAQAGNMNIDGAMLAGRFAANPNASGSTPLLLQNVSSPTVNQLTLLLGSTVYAALDKRGSLVTLESSRIAPWIEPMVVGTATTISSTTAADLNGLTVTFTPPSDCRVAVMAILDGKMTATGSGFIGELLVNGSADSNQIIWNPQTNNERAPVIGAWTAALTGNTSYTIKLQGKLSGGAGTFSIAAGSRMLIIAVGRIP